MPSSRHVAKPRFAPSEPPARDANEGNNANDDSDFDDSANNAADPVYAGGDQAGGGVENGAPGDDGLDAMRVVERVAWRLLRPGGGVGAEHADAQGEAAPAVFTGRWSAVRDHLDLADRPRFVTAQRP